MEARPSRDNGGRARLPLEVLGAVSFQDTHLRQQQFLPTCNLDSRRFVCAFCNSLRLYESGIACHIDRCLDRFLRRMSLGRELQVL